MVKRYLGYGITNANGVAKLEYAPDGTALTHSYTGVGAGKIDVIAKSGDLESSIYELVDCLFYNNKTEWYNASTRLTVTQNSDGSTTLENTTVNNGYYLANQIGTSKSSYADVNEWELGACIEFDLVSTSDLGNIVQLNDYNNNIASTKTFTALECTENNHIRIEVATNGSVSYYVDTGVPKSATAQTDTFAVGFRVNPNTSLTFKNFKIYPI